MKTIRNMKRPSLATIIASLALFIAIGGTATAASGLINGKSIKKGTITAKQIKNKTITSAKISPSTLTSLKGAQGEKGEQGKQGIQGVQGVPGVAGPITTFTESGSKTNQPANTETSIVDMTNLPGKRYLATATVVAFSQTAGAQVSCGLSASNGGGSASANWTAPTNGARTTLPLTFTTSTATNHIELTCNPGASVAAYDGNVVLVQLN